jgi:hypothetical protein
VYPVQWERPSDVRAAAKTIAGIVPVLENDWRHHPHQQHRSVGGTTDAADDLPPQRETRRHTTVG